MPIPTITHASAPAFSSPDLTTIDVVLSTVELGDIPFSVSATTDDYGLWARLMSGEFGDIAAFQPPSAEVAHATTVTRRQFFLGLHAWQMTEEATAAVEAVGGVTKISWETASRFSISDPALVAVVTSLGKSHLLQEFFDFCAGL